MSDFTMPENESKDSEKVGPLSPSEKMHPSSVLVTRTFLEMTALSQLESGRPPAVAASLERLDPCPEATWRALYRQIGAPWHWHDRDAWDEGRMLAHLARPEISVYRAMADLAMPSGLAAGFFELERHDDGSVEIAYLGLDRHVLGHGLGAWLVANAVRIAFESGASRVWLHTCTLDAPAALPNYLARGFVATRVETYHQSLLAPD